MSAEEYGTEMEPELVKVVDEEGEEHQFEVLDAIETEEGRFVAMLPYYEDPAAAPEDDGDGEELIVLQVVEENGEDMLVPIEDEALFDEIAALFEERLEEMFEVEEDG